MENISRAVNPDEVLSTVAGLAPNIGLMIGEDDFSLIRRDSRIA